MAELNKMKQRRATIKGHITRAENSFNTVENMSVSEAQVRLKKIDGYFEKFLEVQEQIEEVEVAAATKEAFDTENEAERSVFEERYYAVATKAQKIIDNAQAQHQNLNRTIHHLQQNNEANGQNTIRVETTHKNRPRLPEMKLPEFDGDWTKWLFFRNSFETAIYGDDNLSIMQKHQYLIGLLQGEARRVIEGFEINNTNCPVVWQLLKDTYDNGMMIIETHLEQLLNFPDVAKEDKAESIKTLIWHIQIHVQSLKALKQPVESWDSIIIHLAKKKLDYTEQKEWQDHIKGKSPENMPTLAEFVKFFTERCHTLRMLSQATEKPSSVTGTDVSKQSERKDKKVGRNVMLATHQTCGICDGEHYTFRCEDLLKLNPIEARKLVREKKLCLNCLKAGHIARQCESSTCKVCGEKHNSLLHVHDSDKPAQVNCCTESLGPQTGITLYCTKSSTMQVISATAKVFTFNVKGEKVMIRALLDPGSQVNLMTDGLAKKLKLPCEKQVKAISGIEQARTNVSKVMNIKIQSATGTFNTQMECSVLSSITEKLPQTRIDTSKIKVPQEVSLSQLADPCYEEPGNIDLLIGGGVYWQLVMGAPLNSTIGQPAWQYTKLGWIIGGQLDEAESASSSTCFKVTNAQLHQQLEKFWMHEALPEEIYYSKEEQYCEHQFIETTQQNSEGRFIVRLPLRQEITLGESQSIALKRLKSVERRFQRDPELATAYRAFMRDYLHQGHMTQITDATALEEEECYFIPHQSVVRADSLTTKLRVVFDASSKSSAGTSLNDKLLPGPNLQGDLLKILIRFRTHQIVLTGDIARMYRQILVHPEDRKYQLILWRTDPEEQVKTFQLNTVTYGTACAPFHAIRCLRELVQKHGDEFPMAANAINNDFYMDDGLSGGRDIHEVRELQRQLSELLTKGMFLMRKWRSNEPKVYQPISNGHSEDDLLILDKEDALKTLGLLWNAKLDTLQYKVNISTETKNTKRTILSRISQIFDPLGIIAPVLVQGKLFMQKLWCLEVDWDDPIPEELFSQWNEYYSELPALNELMIHRNVNPQNLTTKIDLYGFGDASEKAFGACIYAISQDQQGEAKSRLICSKSKVAPLRSISLPRLELEAALLLSRLVKTVAAALGNKTGDVHLWSDSTIVLGWIQTEPNRLQTFVANRVSRIQTQTEGVTWSHVPTAENPADIISRGATVQSLINNQLWWYGPPWLREVSKRPHSSATPETELPEMKNIKVSLPIATTPELLVQFSSYRKLCRVVAYIHRFLDIKCRRKERKGALQLSEIQRAEETVLRWLQLDSFLQERRCLQAGRILPRKSPLRSLSVFLGHDDLIRVGGRLRHADINETQKHPIVIPANHHVTKMIMKEEHERLRHCPPDQLLNSLRQKFWPIQGRRGAQTIVKKCIPCFKYHPRIPETLMGELPPERVQAFSRPFSVTGIDYFGPIQVRESKRRGRIHISKGYVAIFVCLSTKAIHIELVTDLTTESFLATLSRFTARRGLCSKIFSDNGTYFVGAARELQELYAFVKKEESEIASFLEKQKIEWLFIPPRSPHFGGLWEAAVKITKRHLHTVTQGKVHTFEEYYTLLTEIEAVLNSRPLTPLSNDPNDLTILTPSHFLVGDSLTQPVRANLIDVTDSRLSRWQYLQKQRQIFWKRWQHEYLHELQKRTKWCDPSPNIQLDTLVLLIEENVPPLHWPRGRVIEIHPGKDGLVRVVTVRTQNGTYKRSVKKVCPLPSNDDE